MGDLRADLTVINKETDQITIIDMTIPFESDCYVFTKTRSEK